MTPDEAMAYARKVCEEERGLIWLDDFHKDDSGWNSPIVIGINTTEEKIKKYIRGAIETTYHPAAKYYKVYIEMCKDAVGNDAYKIYFFY